MEWQPVLKDSMFSRRISATAVESKKKKHDPYAEKMHTAAVMLAQLYQQQQRDDQLSLINGVEDKSKSGAHLLAQTRFHEIRSRVIQEMMMLEKQRMESLSDTDMQYELMSDLTGTGKDVQVEKLVVDHEDPSGIGIMTLASVFREPWDVKQDRIRTLSPYARHPGWRLMSVIVKTGADLRQEQLALQLIQEMHNIWLQAGSQVRVYPFKILITSHQSGLIETIPDAVSIHSIKKDGFTCNNGVPFSLYDHFIRVRNF